MTALTPTELLLRAQDDIDTAHHLWTDHPLDPTTLAHLRCRLESAQADALIALGRLLGEHLERVDHPPRIVDAGAMTYEQALAATEQMKTDERFYDPLVGRGNHFLRDDGAARTDEELVLMASKIVHDETSLSAQERLEQLQDLLSGVRLHPGR